jgi:hypothetical protein
MDGQFPHDLRSGVGVRGKCSGGVFCFPGISNIHLPCALLDCSWSLPFGVASADTPVLLVSRVVCAGDLRRSSLHQYGHGHEDYRLCLTRTFMTSSRASGKLIDIVLANGRRLWCRRYVIASTYEGFQIRTPSEHSNEAMLDGVRKEIPRYFGEGWPAHFILPVRKPGHIDYPEFRITALFTSIPIDDKYDLSSLIFVWFQDEQFPVPDSSARVAFETIEWERTALDYEM